MFWRHWVKLVLGIISLPSVELGTWCLVLTNGPQTFHSCASLGSLVETPRLQLTSGSIESTSKGSFLRQGGYKSMLRIHLSL